MTPAQLRRICNSLNDHRGTGGQTRLAELLGVHPTLIRKKLAGTVPISKKDELAIQQVTEESSATCRSRARRKREKERP